MRSNDPIEAFASKIKEDFSERPSEGDICLQILSYLSSRRFEEVQHLTIQSFYKLVTPTPNDESLLNAIRYLNGERIKVLVTKFEYIDENDEPFVIPLDELKHLQKTGEYAHPTSGELVSNPKDQVYMFFSPSEELKGLQPSK